MNHVSRERQTSISSSLERNRASMPVKSRRLEAYLVVILSFFAIFVAFTVRICLSQAMIPMAQHHGWSEEQQGYLFGAFYYGYITTIIPGGWFSQVFGSKYVILFGILGSSFLNSFSPVASYSFAAFMILRITVGIVQGVFWPSCLHLLSCWIEGNHRTLAVAFVLSGQHLGTAAAQGVYPILADTYGWKMPFYLIGVLGFIWSGLWYYYISSHPMDPQLNDHHRTTPSTFSHSAVLEEKKNYIPSLEQLESSITLAYHSENNQVEERVELEFENPLERTSTSIESNNGIEYLEHHPVPWWSIFTYSSVWAYFILFFCYNWSFYLLVSYLPKYLNFVLGYSPSKAGNLAVFAYLGLYVSILLGGRVTTYCIGRGYYITSIRKLGVSVGLLPAIILLLSLYWFQEPNVVSAILIIAITFTGFAHSAFAPNPMDLIPKAPALIASFGNVIGTLPGFISSMVAGLILQAGQCENQFPVSQTCRQSWQAIFLLCIVIYAIGWGCWIAFASGRPLRRKHPQYYQPLPT